MDFVNNKILKYYSVSIIYYKFIKDDNETEEKID